jgi:TonB family protein
MLDALILAAALLAPPPLQCLDSHGRPSADRPVRLDSTMRRPELIHRVNPTLPEGRQPLGVILIESIVDRRGRVCAARLQKGAEPLATAFLKAVKQWKFKPATRNGKAVAVFYDVTVNFDLRRK